MARITTALAPSYAWCRARPYTLLAAALLMGLAGPFLLRNQSEFEAVYLRSAHLLRAGEDIYESDHGNRYPPFATFIALPWTVLPGTPGRVAWLGLNLAGLVVLVRLAWSLAGGPNLHTKGTPWREHLAALVGILCAASALLNCWGHQQADIVLGALLVVGITLVPRGRGLGAATCFAAVAAVKCTALLWVPYLLWRGRWGAAAWLLLLTLGLNLLPELVHRPPSGRTWLGEYTTRYLTPIGGQGYFLGSWFSSPVYNQSVAGAAQRWLCTDLVYGGNDIDLAEAAPRLDARVQKVLVLGVGLLLSGLVVGVCGRPFRPTEGGTTPEGIPPHAVEGGMVLLLMLLLSPMSSPAHFGVVLLPAFCLARAAVYRRDGYCWALLVLGVGCGLLSNKDLVGSRVYTLALWYGQVMAMALFLLAGLLVLRRHPKEGATEALPGHAALSRCAA